MNTFRGSPLLIAAHAGFASDPARLTRETPFFTDFEHLKSKKIKNLGFFSFFRFEVLKIDRQGSPGPSPPSDPSEIPVESESKSRRFRIKNLIFFERLGIDLGVSESV